MLTKLVGGSAAHDLITMVQYKTLDITYHKKRDRCTYVGETRGLRANRYWKLGLDSYRDITIKELVRYLSDKGYESREKINRPGVVDAIGRCQRGLMSYEGRGVKELKAFCIARGLPAKATTASRLARSLEKADDLATFRRFFELPAEIRNIIYELHFHEFDPFKDQFVQPPLTLASRQLRSEALPVFYDCATFDLSAGSLLPPRRRGVVQPEPPYIQLYDSCFFHMPATNFECFKKFNLRWTKFQRVQVQVDVRITATRELENPTSTNLKFRDALKLGLESKFRTIENAYEMLETGGQPLTLSISGDLFNPVPSGRYVSGGSSLVFRTAKFD